MNSNFVILNKCKDLYKYIYCYVFSSFPKKDLALKIKLETHIHELVENVIRANVNKGNIRKKHQVETLIHINLIDYYLGLIYDNKEILKRRYEVILEKLLLIRKLVLSWISNEKSF